MSFTFSKWPEIKSFSNTYSSIEIYPQSLLGSSNVKYVSKIKLDGTNAAIHISLDGNVGAQSRNKLITPNDDNHGFANFVEKTKLFWLNAKQKCATILNSDILIHGEWTNAATNKNNVACNKIPNRLFAIFAIQYGDNLIVDSNEIASNLGIKFFQQLEIDNSVVDVSVIPLYDFKCEIDFSQPKEKLQLIVDEINKKIAEVEECDPYIKSEYNISGIGEGLVFYPISHMQSGQSKNNFANLAFKAKGEKHKTVATKSPVEIDTQKLLSVEAFIPFVLTEARLKQGLENIDSLDRKNVGKFLQWISGDIQKECQNEMRASGLLWKDIQKPLTDYARKWFFNRI